LKNVTIYYPNKDKYRGEIIKGMRHGEGELIKANGSVFKGKFE